LARIVGPIGVSFWLFALAAAGAAVWLQRTERGWRSHRSALLVLLVLLVSQAIGQFAPHGDDTGETLRIAIVQGGGPQGVLAINTNPRDVTQRHLTATDLLSPVDDIDLVLWPENTIDVNDFSTSKARDEVAAQARRLGALMAVGVTEDAGTNFTNAQIVVDAEGNELSRYDKVRRVPYGEYIPLRSLLGALGAPVDRIPRDAVPGTTRATITVPSTSGTSATTSSTDSLGVPLAVAISWEVFFSSRVDDGVAAGGQVVLNPTNGSSYTGEILQQQQVATSQLRAIESGRYLVQAATTGFSLVVDPDGRVLKKLSIGEQAVIVHDVPLRNGRTPYSYLGDVTIAVALILLVVAIAARSRRRAEATPQGAAT
jgi:apolipoprotein N-acyltransferase